MAGAQELWGSVAASWRGIKKDTKSLASACPALPDLREAEVGGNETWRTKLKTTMECFTQEGISWPTM